MNNQKDSRTYTSSRITRQQTTTVSQTISSSRTSSSYSSTSYVSPYRSVTCTSSSLGPTNFTSQYQPVYTSRFNRSNASSRWLPHSVNTPAAVSISARPSILATSNNIRRTTLPSIESGIKSDAKRFGSYPGITKSSTCSAPERYNLRAGKGYVLIFHHKHFKNNKASIRLGSEKDLKLLKEFFVKYRVKQPEVCEDYTVERMKKKMAEVSKKNFSSYSCMLIIVMSHGETRERIQAYDAMYNFETEIVDRVLMNETLKGKPKVFFIQACKGNARMETDYHESATNKIDIMKCYSTYEGTVSFRDPKMGTYFIQELFKLIDGNADKDLADMMVVLRKRFHEDGIEQAPTDVSTLTKKFFFSDLK